MPAPFGNRYAVGNNGGKPPAYESAEQLQLECDDYFEFIKGEFHYEQQEVATKDGPVLQNVIVWDRRPETTTITGLALFLGFCSRQSIYDYAAKEEFAYIIKRAMARIEQGYEFGLAGTSPTGSIFALKNMGWKDKTEVDTNINAHIGDSPIEFK